MRTGRAARTARVKTRVMILGGDLGSVRKMWWISGRDLYRTGDCGTVTGAAGSVATVSLKDGEEKPVEEPNEAMVRIADNGFLEARNCAGSSLAVCEVSA